MSAVAQDLQELFENCQKRLGRAARLGVSGVLFDRRGERRADIAFNQDEPFPMASVVKVPVAMFAASEIAGGSLSLDEKITIHTRTASPGLIGNPLDRFYFLPLNTVRTHTVDELMGFMFHDSDNTATDALLQRLGGISTLMKFLIRELHVKGISIKRTMDELLTYYYHLHPHDASGESHQGPKSIIRNVWRMRSPFVCRQNREEHLIDSGEDTCTPRAMADLLTLLTTNPKYAVVYSHMQRCATNKRRIAEGLKEHRSLIDSFGHKTGSVGAIANDAGVIHFKKGYFAVLAVMTFLSMTRTSIRDKQIAAVTCAIISQWRMDHLAENCLH